jgi:uncharacterized protein (TIGR02217 family)
MAFFESPRFPDDISYNSVANTEYKTDIIDMSGGAESRLSRWADARRSYNAAFGVRTRPQLDALIAFFHSCKGKAHGFRYNDPIDNSSADFGAYVSAVDQIIIPVGTSTTLYQLRKRYNSGATVYRDIKKPVSGSVVIAIAGVPQASGWTVDTTTGVITFAVAPSGTVTAGFLFDVPCRFDTDQLSADLVSYNLVSTDVPVVEIRT